MVRFPAMLRAGVAFVVLGALSSAPVAAQPDASTRSKAKELTERAIEKMRVGEYAEAIDLYLRAYELSQEAILLSNIGSAYQSLGKRERALNYFCRYLEEDPRGRLAEFARGQAQDVARELGHAEPCVPASRTPATSQSPRPPRSARASDPAELPEPSPFAIETSSSASASPGHSSSASGPLQLGGLVLTGGGAVALGLGGYYGWVGKRASDRITNNKDGWTQQILDQQAIGQRANRNMTISLVVGGAATITGVALYLWGRSMKRSNDEPRTALVPAVTPESSGLTIVGVFD